MFDLEILLIYPYSVSSYNNDIYGLIILIIFFILLTMGFIYELGKNALTIDSRQISAVNKDLPKPYGFTKGALKANVASLCVAGEILIPKPICGGLVYL